MYLRWFLLFKLFMIVRTLDECTRITCQGQQRGGSGLNMIINRVPYLAGIRRIGEQEPYCFGVFVNDVHVLTSSFCDEDVKSIEAVYVPVSPDRYGYSDIEKATITNKVKGSEIMSFQISHRISPSNAYFKSKKPDIIRNEMIQIANFLQKTVFVLGFGSYSFIPNHKPEMKNAKYLMSAAFYLKSAYFGKYFLSIDDCCWRMIDPDDARSWRRQRIFLLESHTHNYRCYAETGSPVIGTDGYVYGVVRGHYDCSPNSRRPDLIKRAQVAVSGFVDTNIIASVLEGNTQDIYPPAIHPDMGAEDSGLGTGIVDQKDPIKVNQTLRELAYYGDDYYYGNAIIFKKPTSSLFFLSFILVVFILK